MKEETSQPPPQPPPQPTPQAPSQPPPKKKRTRPYIAVALIVIIAIAIIASNPRFLPHPKITQVQIKVEYSGAWKGAYGDQTGMTNWSGQGSKTITLNRPSPAEMIWIISANAQKTDGSADTLRIMITKTDGTILKEGTSDTTPYGASQISYTIRD